jgi:hypothetical protein
MFYNPVVTYTAPLKYDGTSYPDMNSTNTSTWTQVPADPYLFSTKYVNLQTKVSVGVWCNTTYAGGFTLPNGVAADRDGIAIGGDYCRINGFPYAASTVTGNSAPKTDGDYSYPYAKVAADADNSKYFATTQRTIYCDPNRMNGKTGSATTEVAPTAPTCNACPLSCAVAQVPDPANPPGCDLGCTNPAECTMCGTKCPQALTYNCGTTCSTPALNCTASGGGNYAAIGPKTCPDGANEKCTPHPGTCPAPGAWTLDAAACTTKINGLSKVAFTPTAGTVIGTTTYEQDANLNGDVCRRNNFTYTSGAAGGWTYPGSGYTSPVNCGAVTATINRHYYKAAVQWCDTQLPTAGSNDKWRGFGKGNCQAEKTSVYKYPKYVKFGADLAVAQDNYTDAAFYLVELDYKNKKIIERNGTPATKISHSYDDGTGTVTITRDSTSDTPAASELVNYANWFAYYRTRILAAKTVTSLAFSELTDKFRVGFHTLSNVPATSFLTVDDFKSTAGGQRDLWFARLAGVSIPMGNDTPLLDGVVRIGDWFKSTTGSLGSLSGSTDPIKLSCQKNYHMMFTDGYTNQNGKPATTVGNLDGAKIPTLPESIVSLPTGSDWPWRYREGTTAVDDSLADYTLYYWMTDLRPTSFAKNLSDNNVPTSSRDPAKWQHLNFAGAVARHRGQPVVAQRQQDRGEHRHGRHALALAADDRDGQPARHHGRRRPVARRRQRAQPVRERARSVRAAAGHAVDPARDPEPAGVARGGRVLERRVHRQGQLHLPRDDRAGLGRHAHQGRGRPAGRGRREDGDHELPRRAGRAGHAASAGDTPWYDKRNVVTWNPSSSQGGPFKLANLTATQQSSLGGTAAVQQKIVDYLRGDRSNEGTALKNFRVRTQILGDIDNSSPVVVGQAKGQYSDSTDPGYETFKAGTASRKKMVYVGANDGMLHAFDDAAGTELFAYIPSFMYSSDPDKGLAMLAKKEPFFKHQMFVDSTPVAADFYSKADGKWKTYVIGGLGKGGKGYYAIDVTDPGAIKTEADAAAAVKWEFTDSEMGYSYGKPLIAKDVRARLGRDLPVGLRRDR